MKLFAGKRKSTFALGRRGEDAAVRLLQKLGMTILDRNYRCKAGELDIVALDGDEIVFAEVKTIRRHPEFTPGMNLSLNQRKRNRNAALFYLRSCEADNIRVRFDLVGVTFSKSGRILLDIENTRDYLPPFLWRRKAELPEKECPGTVEVSAPEQGWNFFPCPGCISGSGARANSFCPECLEKLPFINRERNLCPGCGGVNNDFLALCSQCIVEELRPWQDALALMEYRDYAKELIRKYKFNNFPVLARAFGIELAGQLRKAAWQTDIFIPVPLSLKRLRERGYNQAALPIDIAAAELGVPVVNALKRSDNRAKQSGRKKQERHKDLAGLFQLQVSPETLAGKHIVVVDDILTTGATLSAAVKALLASSSPASVKVAVLARTPAYSAGESILS